MDRRRAATHRLDEDVADEAGADARGDRVREGHEGDRQEGRDRDLQVLPIDLLDLLHHEEADEHERGGGRLVGHDCDEGRQEGREQEEHARDDRGQTGAGPLADTGGRLDVARVGADRSSTTGRGGERVDDEDPLRVRRVALLVEQVALRADGDHRAHRVEEVREQDREDEQRRRDDPDLVEGAQQVEVAEQAELRRGGDGVGHLRDVEPPAGRVDQLTRLVGLRADAEDRLDDHREDRRAEDAVEDRALHAAHVQRDDDEEADDEDEQRPAGEEAADTQLTQGTPFGLADEAGVDEADDGDEEADADGDGRLERRRHGVQHRLAEAGEHEQQDDQALEDHEAHRVRPGHLRQLGDAEGDEGVEPQARGEGQRIVGHDPHEQGHDPRHEGGARRDHREVGLVAPTEEAARRVGLGPDDQRVEDDDVGHREEGREATADLPADRRATLVDLEVPLDRGALRRGRSRRAHRVSSTSSSRIGVPTFSGSGASMSTSECAPQPWSLLTTVPSLGLHSLAQTPKTERSAPAIGRK